MRRTEIKVNMKISKVKEWTLIFPLHCDLAELSLSFTLYFPFRSDLLKGFYHSEVIWWTLNSRLISLTLFVKQVIILVQSFLDNDFLLDFSLVVSLQFVPLRCSVLSISRNSVRNSDAFTFMLIETSIGEIFHLSRNICSESFRWWPNRNVMGHQELDIFLW